MIVLHIEYENFESETEKPSKECIVVEKLTKKFLDNYIMDNYFNYTYADVKGSVAIYRTLSKCAVVTAFKPKVIKGEI